MGVSHGDGGDPSDPAFAFPRTVDFGAAACMVLATEAFRAVGGFDAAYAPAYYEDADLCLRLAEAGLRTTYVPSVRVMHARYGSGSSTTAKELSERNRGRFMTRWARLLAERPATLWPPHAARTLAARDAPTEGRVLVLEGDAALLEVLADRPALRVTLFAHGERPAWLARGIECVDAGGDVAAWLATRRFHYDVVVVDDHEHTEAIGATQPQAELLVAPTSDDLAAQLALFGA
jgi:hypothetical protein